MIAYAHTLFCATNSGRRSGGPVLGRRIRNISRQCSTVCFSLVAALASVNSTAGLAAFPGAEGGGALAVGGRGGEVCRVTNLNDSGPGSLRSCVAMQGPRTVVFDIGGTIVLNSSLNISHPYITIAGQTAPGGGIQLRANKDIVWPGTEDLVRVWTHDVVIRFLRIRMGWTGKDAGNLSVGVGGVNVMLDHLSLSWSANQNFTTRSWTDPKPHPRNITLQNSIVTEMINGRVNMLINSADLLSSTDIDFHNNYIANSSHRNPRIRVSRGRFINNIVYNWGKSGGGGWGTRFEEAGHYDIIGNLWRMGPNLAAYSDTQNVPALMFRSPDLFAGESRGYFLEGNRDTSSGMEPNTDNWPYTRESGPLQNDRAIGPTPMEWRRYATLPSALIDGTPIPPITARHADDLEGHLLPILGASHRLDCGGNWVTNRDAADQRVIAEYLNNEGTHTVAGQGEEIYGGHPSLARGIPCVDTSGDGIPDEWAIAEGFDPSDGSLGNRPHESGYTYLELYLNGMPIGLPSPSRMDRPTVE